MVAGATYISKVECKKCGSNVRYVSSSNCKACANLASKNRKLITGPLRFLEPSEYPVSREAAAALRTRKYVPESPCKHGHMTLRDTRTGDCYECRRRHRQRKAPAAQRRNPTILADRKARWQAEENLQRKYVSPRGCPRCKRGAPERYVRGGACVSCAASASRNRYASTARAPKAAAAPLAGPALWESWFRED